MPSTSQNAAPRRRVFPVPAVAEATGLSERTVRALIAAGKLATIRLSSRRIGVDERDLDAFLDSRRTPATR